VRGTPITRNFRHAWYSSASVPAAPEYSNSAQQFGSSPVSGRLPHKCPDL
jgi:hypothetical protein